VGRLGEVTGELLDDLGPPYRVGDTVGRSGLERAFERRLAGTPTQEARIMDGSYLVATLSYREGAEPEPLQTTLDPTVQQAAVAALSGISDPAAVVVVDAPTGEVRAAAWTSDLPIALSGRYPPGSTFKVVDAAALLAGGAEHGSPLDCPGDVRIGGRVFTNAGSYGPGQISLLEAFARSCNTAFAREAVTLGPDKLAEAAGWFGFGLDYDAGLPAFGGSFPSPVDAAELAAAAIGQGRVEASPLHMASVAAAVRSGTWQAPHLIRGATVPSRELPPGVTGPLDVLMREVVATGTGTAAAVGGEPPVTGKTGSAEFGDGSRTHAWFVGYRGDLAFAVFIEGGGGGGSVAGPVAARLLTALP
jgi:cell division protein FtsI/penicillin-binding protein 2